MPKSGRITDISLHKNCKMRSKHECPMHSKFDITIYTVQLEYLKGEKFSHGFIFAREYFLHFAWIYFRELDLSEFFARIYFREFLSFIKIFYTHFDFFSFNFFIFNLFDRCSTTVMVRKSFGRLTNKG